MKTKSLVCLTLAFASVLLSGCKDGLWDTIAPKSQLEVKPAQVVTVNEVKTNYVSETVFKTNVVTIDVTNTVTHEVTQTQQAQITPQVILSPVFITNQVTRTNAAVFADQIDTSRIESGIKTGGTVASGVGVPFATAGAAAVGLIVHIVGSFYNRRKLAKAKNEHDGAMDIAQDAVKTLVQNVEQARGVIKQFPGGDKADEKLVAAMQVVQDIGSDTHKLIVSHVEEHTNTIPVPTI